MLEINLGLFLSASILLAVTPGPGILYVLARTLRGGRAEGLRSTAGTAVGGLFHVFAAALGLSALLATSALAFGVIKYAGAAYLIYLGLRMIISRDPGELSSNETLSRRAFRQGIVTEALNPKTALFFLAFIPQFITPDANIFLQFVLLGCVSVFLNTAADFIVVMLAGPIAERLERSRKLRRSQRLASGGALIALGGYVALGSSG